MNPENQKGVSPVPGVTASGGPDGSHPPFHARLGLRDWGVEMLICVLLVFLTVAVFWPVQQCGFVSYDDAWFVTDNPHVLRGLTWEGLSWAFRSGFCGSWVPLAWLSHMLDVELFGLN